MSRPIKDTVDFFPHDTKLGKTARIIQSKYGNDGYAVMFKTFELLGASHGHTYNFNDELEYEDMVAYYGAEESLCMQILSTLAKLGTLDKDLFSKKILWSDSFIERLKPLYARRIDELPKKPSTKTKLMSTENNKGKERKGKERKGKKNISSEASRLTDLLIVKILEHLPNYRELQPKKCEKTKWRWYEDVEKMLRIDKRPVDESIKIIIWCQEDKFWKANILSGEKLRNQYDKVLSAMNRQSDKSGYDPSGGWDK